MKILFGNKYFYLKGGSEKVFFQERNFLLGEGFEVLDFSMSDNRNYKSPFSDYFTPNINFHQNVSLTKRIIQLYSFIHSKNAVKKVKDLINEIKPDIAHLHNIYHQLTPSIIPVLKKNGVKVIMTLHDTKLICPGYLALNNGEICTECEGKYFRKSITLNCQNSLGTGIILAAEAYYHKLKNSYEGVDIFICPSNFLAELTCMRIPRNKIRVLKNGIDVNRYKPNFDDKGYCLYFGRISKEKGIKTLLIAHKKMSKNYPLKIIGDGSLGQELKQEFTDAEFLGYKVGSELNDLIKNAAFVIVPSEWYENCSMVVLEAMAFGKPIIGSNIGGIPEQIEDGRTGFLFEKGNYDELAQKMFLMVTDKEMRRKMGIAARKKIEKDYSLKGHCDKLLDIYSELLDRDVRKDIHEKVH